MSDFLYIYERPVGVSQPLHSEPFLCGTPAMLPIVNVLNRHVELDENHYMFCMLASKPSLNLVKLVSGSGYYCSGSSWIELFRSAVH